MNSIARNSPMSGELNVISFKRAMICWFGNSENSKANRIETMKGPAESGQICWVGRRKIAKKIAKNKRCYANTLRPRSKMLLKVMKGGLGGVITPWVILGGGSLSPGSISALRVTWDAASWLLAEKRHSEMQHSPLPPTTCSWIAEWMDRRVVRELFPVTRNAIPL